MIFVRKAEQNNWKILEAKQEPKDEVTNMAIEEDMISIHEEFVCDDEEVIEDDQTETEEPILFVNSEIELQETQPLKKQKVSLGREYAICKDVN